VNRERRDALIHTELDARGRSQLVESIARQIARRVPPCFDYDDLVAAGMVGLIKAAEAFQPGRASFRTYSSVRIKGEILDSIGLHGAEDKPRHQRTAWAESTRPPISSEEQHEPADPRSVVSIEEGIEHRKRNEKLTAAISRLPGREAVVIDMHYRGEISLHDIATKAGFEVHASRVSQIHNRALRRLRADYALRGQKAA